MKNKLKINRSVIFFVLVLSLLIISGLVLYSLNVVENKETNQNSQRVLIKLPEGTKGEGVWFEPQGIKVLRGYE